MDPPRCHSTASGLSGFSSFSGNAQDASELKAAASIDLPLKRAHAMLRKSALANTKRVVERETLIEVIEDDARRWNGCLMLPVTVLFFMFYSAAAALHEDVASGHLMESPVRRALVPPLDPDEEPNATMLQGVVTIPDTYQYINETFLPLFFRQTDAFGYPLPQQDWGTIYQYSQVVGMVSMELTRSVRRNCTLEHATHMYCYPQDEPTGEPFGRGLDDLPGGRDYYLSGDEPVIACEDEGFATTLCGADADGRRLEIARQELQRMMPPGDVDDSLKYRFLLDSNTSLAQVMKRFNYLKERGWLDEQSTRLKLSVNFLNVQLAVPILETCDVTFMFSRGGGIFSMIRMETLVLRMFNSTWSYVFDILFCLMLLASTCYMISELLIASRAGMVRYHFSVVNIVTWLTCFFGWFNVGGMIITHIWRKELLSQLELYTQFPSERAALRLQESVDSMMFYVDGLRLFVADAHLLFMCRCFISLQWQPRLAVVTQTLTATSTDLFHFMIVLIPTFFAFAISGMMMFGRRLEDFATPASAMATCFKIAMESEFKWKELSAQDFWTSATWVWVYLLLVVLLMLNMVLAIIMDVYQEVRQHSGKSITLWSNVLYIFRALRHRKQWIRTADLLDQVSEMSQTITLQELQTAFPEMHEYQMQYLTTACTNKAQVVSRVGINAGYTAQMVAAIHLSLEEVLRDVDELKSRGWLGKGMEVKNDTDREVIKDILTSIAMQNHWMELTQKNLMGLQCKLLGYDEQMSYQPSRRPAPAAPFDINALQGGAAEGQGEAL